jgi:hypothetical protein
VDDDELIANVIELLQREKRIPYRVLKRRFDLDDDDIENLKIDLIEAKHLPIDENDRILVWTEKTEGAYTQRPQDSESLRIQSPESAVMADITTQT